MNLLLVVSENQYADKQMTRRRVSTFLIYICSLHELCSENAWMGLKGVFGCSVAENSLELLHPVFLYALCDPSLPPNLPMACRQHVWMLLLKTSFQYETKDFLLKILSWLQVSIFNPLNAELNPICKSQLAELFWEVFKFCAWYLKTLSISRTKGDKFVKQKAFCGEGNRHCSVCLQML